jgi:hypothetical protein
MTERVKLINHNGKKIVHVNYSGLSNRNEKEFMETIDYATKFMLMQGKDLLILSDFRESTGNNAIFDKLKVASAKVKPFRKKSAVLGISGVKSIFLKGVNMFSKSDLMSFNDLEEAKNWLAKD